jgi:type I restriction enzyme, S subunit
MKPSKMVKLKDVCQRIMVGYVGPMAQYYQQTGIPYLRSQNIKPNKIDLTDVIYIDEAFNNRIKKSKLQPNDVVVVRTGYPGTAAVIPQSLKTSNCSDLVIIRPGQEINPYYLCNIFNSAFGKDLVSGRLVGAAQQHFNTTTVQELQIPLPNINAQRKIAAILSAYDDLIEVNERRIALLEKMAEELYREWFVRMRFPGHGSINRIKGLPAKWEISTIAVISSSIITGKTPSTQNPGFFNGTIPFIKTPDMHDHMFIISTGESLTQAGAASQKRQTVPEGTICVSCIGTGGIVSITTQDSQTNQQINSIIPKKKEYLEWAYFSLRDQKTVIELFGGTGSTMTNLSKGKLEKLPIVLPEESLIKSFHGYVSPIFSEILEIGKINTRLANTRGRLLSRLMSGALDVEKLDIAFPPSMEEGTANS